MTDDRRYPGMDDRAMTDWDFRPGDGKHGGVGIFLALAAAIALFVSLGLAFASPASAEPVTFCIKGKTGIAIKFARGTEPSHPCIAWQKQVTVDAAVAPSPQELRAGLVPEIATTEVVEGSTTGTRGLAQYPLDVVFDGFFLDANILVDVVASDDYPGIGGGCTLWFHIAGVFHRDAPVLNLNGRPNFDGFTDHSFPNAQDAYVAVIIGPAPNGQARMADGPVRFMIEDTAFRFDDAQVAFNAMGKDGCWGSARVTVE